MFKGLWWQLCEVEIPQNLRRYVPIKPSLSEGQASAAVPRNVSHVQLPSLVCHVKSPIRLCILGQKKAQSSLLRTIVLAWGRKSELTGWSAKVYVWPEFRTSHGCNSPTSTNGNKVPGAFGAENDFSRRDDGGCSCIAGSVENPAIAKACSTGMRHPYPVWGRPFVMPRGLAFPIWVWRG